MDSIMVRKGKSFIKIKKSLKKLLTIIPRIANM